MLGAVLCPLPLLAAAPPAPSSAPALLSDDAVAIIKDEGIEARLINGQEIFLAVQPEKGDGYIAMARRLCRDEKAWPALQAANGGREIVLGQPVMVPWDLMRLEYRYLALLALFPEDAPTEKGWRHFPHKSRAETFGEGFWQVALWFTDKGENWEKIALANKVSGPDLPEEQALTIPKALLLPLFRRVDESDDGRLTFHEDKKGAYAEYRLKKKEALYTAVVLRFMDLVDPEDVSHAAARVAKRSGIRDVRKIPVGKRIKIPLDMLALGALPANHPRRIAARITESELASVRLPPKVKTLKGVHILLDPGHGGKDPGAIQNGIWESEYVYDVSCRIKRLLERDTGASVHVMTRDTENGYKVFETKKIPKNQREVVDVHPPYKIKAGRSGTRIGVNLRWYLANAIYRDLSAKKVPSDKIVFVSLHADSLHRSLRGAMVYVPGERFRKGKFGHRGKSYRRYREVKSAKKVSFTRKQRLRDEAVSRRLANAILEGYRQEKLPVHKHIPVRNHIRRGKRRFAPAVIRGNQVPAKVLLETVNLGNKDDAKLLADPAGRERIARAVVAGLRKFYE